MINNILIVTAFAFLFSLLSHKVVKKAKMPNVTGYLIVGLIVGPYVLNIIPEEMITSLKLIPEVALGFIALSIGSEFKLSYLKKVGKAPVVIACLEGFGATIVVDLTLILTGHDVPFSLCLGAIAAATAPAATMMVVRQYKAHGPVTETLLPVVAIDDAVALISFGVSVAIAKAIQDPSGGSLVMALIKPVISIFETFALGFILGLAFSLLCKYFRSNGNRLCIAIMMVFLALGLCEATGLSDLLCVMMMSATYINLSDSYERVFSSVDIITVPIFMLFFFLSGADLDVRIISSVGVIGIIYVVFRCVGKVAGASLGCTICKCSDTVKKYLGFTLIPQAGVAIGLATQSMTVVPEFGKQIKTIILCGTVIYELVGPLITKIALTKAGEIKQA